jgi:hypothetical protein
MSETLAENDPASVVESERRRRNLRAATLLRKWLAESHTGEDDDLSDPELLTPQPIRLRDVDFPCP